MPAATPGTQHTSAGTRQLGRREATALQPRLSSRVWVAYWWAQRLLGTCLAAAILLGSAPAVVHRALLALAAAEAAAVVVLLASPHRKGRALGAALGTAFCAAYVSVVVTPDHAVPIPPSASAALRSVCSLGAKFVAAAISLVSHSAALRRRILSHRRGLLACLALEKLVVFAFYSAVLLMAILPCMLLISPFLFLFHIGGGRWPDDMFEPLNPLLEQLFKSMLYPNSWTGVCTIGPSSPPV